MQIASTSARTQRTRNALVRVAAIAQSEAAGSDTRRRPGPDTSDHSTEPSKQQRSARRARTFAPFLSQIAAQNAGRFSATRESRRNPGPALDAYGAADALRTSMRRLQSKPGTKLELSDI